MHDLLKNYPQRWWQQCCADQIWKFRGEHYFRISRSPEPTNILFHNLAYTPAARRNARILTTLLTYVIKLILRVLIIQGRTHEFY